MFDHSVYIAASYLAAAVVLGWCAFAPILGTRKVRAQLAREYSRLNAEKTEGKTE